MMWPLVLGFVVLAFGAPPLVRVGSSQLDEADPTSLSLLQVRVAAKKPVHGKVAADLHVTGHKQTPCEFCQSECLSVATQFTDSCIQKRDCEALEVGSFGCQNRCKQRGVKRAQPCLADCACSKKELAGQDQEEAERMEKQDEIVAAEPEEEVADIIGDESDEGSEQKAQEEQEESGADGATQEVTNEDPFIQNASEDDEDPWYEEEEDEEDEEADEEEDEEDEEADEEEEEEQEEEEDEDDGVLLQGQADVHKAKAEVSPSDFHKVAKQTPCEFCQSECLAVATQFTDSCIQKRDCETLEVGIFGCQNRCKQRGAKRAQPCLADCACSKNELAGQDREEAERLEKHEEIVAAEPENEIEDIIGDDGDEESEQEAEEEDESGGGTAQAVTTDEDPFIQEETDGDEDPWYEEEEDEEEDGESEDESEDESKDESEDEN